MNKEAIKQQVLDGLNFRHACKIFDGTKKITDDDFDFLLQVARLSPTSFGMQGVRLLVITNKELKQKLKPVCWNQNQIDTSSHLVVFLTRTQDLKPNSEYVYTRFKERNLPIEHYEAYLKKYEEFHQNRDTYHWGAKQAYILLGNMTTAAAMIEIDSCPIEGFEKEKVEKILDINTSHEEVILISAFGYRTNPQPSKLRLPLEEISQFIKEDTL